MLLVARAANPLKMFTRSTAIRMRFKLLGFWSGSLEINDTWSRGLFLKISFPAFKCKSYSPPPPDTFASSPHRRARHSSISSASYTEPTSRGLFLTALLSSWNISDCYRTPLTSAPKKGLTHFQ